MRKDVIIRKRWHNASQNATYIAFQNEFQCLLSRYKNVVRIRSYFGFALPFCCITHFLSDAEISFTLLHVQLTIPVLSNMNLQGL